jgi:hypothetical protein
MRAVYHDSRRGRGSRFAVYSLYVMFRHECGEHVIERIFTESYWIFIFFDSYVAYTRQIYSTFVYGCISK